MDYSKFKSFFGWIIVSVLLVNVLMQCAKAEEYYEIYPEMFVEDCKASSYSADTAARVFDFITQPLESNPKMAAYDQFCSCLSDKFFSEAENMSYDDAANNYEWYNMFIEHGSSARSFIKSQQYSPADGMRIRSNIRSCKAEVDKSAQARIAESIPGGEIKTPWASSILEGYKSLPSWAESSVAMEKKAKGLAQCMESKFLESRQSSSIVEMARKEVVEVIRADGNWTVAQNVESRNLAIKAIDECY